MGLIWLKLSGNVDTVFFAANYSLRIMLNYQECFHPVVLSSFSICALKKPGNAMNNLAKILFHGNNLYDNIIITFLIKVSGLLCFWSNTSPMS